MDGSQGEFGFEETPLQPAAVRRFLSDNPEFLRADDGLLAELGLKVAAGNVVEFAPVALARVHAAHQREAEQRHQIEETARANFAAQAQTHGAVVDLLDAEEGVAPGQACVLYDSAAPDARVLGGGIIRSQTAARQGSSVVTAAAHA